MGTNCTKCNCNTFFNEMLETEAQINVVSIVILRIKCLVFLIRLIIDHLKFMPLPKKSAHPKLSTKKRLRKSRHYGEAIMLEKH